MRGVRMGVAETPATERPPAGVAPGKGDAPIWGVAIGWGVAAVVLRGVTPAKSDGWSSGLAPPMRGVCPA